MTVPFTFGTATTSIPLSNLDSNFNTPITLGNTAIYLGNTTTTIGNLTLTNATISSGNVTISNVTVTTANVTNITVAGRATFTASNFGAIAASTGTMQGQTSYGGVLAGNGSSYDVMICNRSGSEVLGVIANTQNLYAAGNVGIGTSSPQALLHVGSVVEAPGFGTTSQMTYINGTSQPELLIRQTVNDVVVSMYADSTSGSIRTATNHPLVFFTNNTERMRITSGGTITLSTTSNGSADIQVVNNTTGLRLVGGTTISTDSQILLTGSASGLNSNIYFDGADKNFRNTAGSVVQMTLSSSGDLALTGNANPTININGTSGAGARGILFSANGIQYARITQNPNTGEMKIFNGESGQTGYFISFSTDNAERMRITNAGVLDIGTGGGAVGQIQFPATQVPSANANTLDDYEEGTWTPSFTLGSGSATATVASGSYVKIGRQVSLTICLEFSVPVAASIEDVTGLPFTAANSANQGVGALRENSVTGFMWQLRPTLNTTTALIRRYDNVAVLADAMRFVGTVTYFV